MDHIKEMMIQNLDAEAREITLAILECAGRRLVERPPSTNDIIVMVTTPSDEGDTSADKKLILGQVSSVVNLLSTVAENVTGHPSPRRAG